jgi:Uri superfamily endonuclease
MTDAKEFSLADILKDRNILPRTRGAYTLEFNIVEAIAPDLRSVGIVPLIAGRYRYYGNAYQSGGLRARIRHHLHPEDRARRWYMVDWVTELVLPGRIMIVAGGHECDLAQADLRSEVRVDELQARVRGAPAEGLR